MKPPTVSTTSKKIYLAMDKVIKYRTYWIFLSDLFLLVISVSFIACEISLR